MTANKAVHPSLEGLEDRLLMYAATGARWQYGSHITYSFMPDGTSLGGTPMVMNQRMNAEGISTAAWELPIQKAAAVWEAVSGIQLAQVFDNGAAVGIYGHQQDDPRFGDIRIGGFSQGNANQLAFTFYPPALNGGTDAGDIFFNTDQPWQTNGSGWDLETVAIHEFGHALGMAHSTVNTAEMYAYYTYTGQQLSTDDIQGIQAIYGAAVADPDNNTLATAIDITPYLNAQGQLTIGNLRLSSPVNDVDWFHVTTPGSSTGQLQVTMQAAGLSSMCPFVLIYNQAGTQILNYAIAPNSYGQGIVNVSVPASAGQGFYIRCQGAQAAYDPGNVGAYGLKINFASTPLPPVSVPSTVIAWQPDQGGGAGSLSISGGSTDPSGSTSSTDLTASSGGSGTQANTAGKDSPSSSAGINTAAKARGYNDDGTHDNDKPKPIKVGSLTAIGDALLIAPAASRTVKLAHPIIVSKGTAAHPKADLHVGHSRMLGHLNRAALQLHS